MGSVQSKVTDDQNLVPFFYLRITGLPFYVFATVNPADSAYGIFSWSAPSGFPSTWAQRGLQLPDDTIDQKFTDLIGGVASPGRCRVSVIDFPDPLHPGFGYFSRLFAPGRAFNDTSIAQARLNGQLVAALSPGSTFIVDGQIGTWTVPGDIYIGAETIGISAALNIFSNAYQLTCAARNKYVCYGNSAGGIGGAYFPPIPYHRSTYAADGSIQDAPRVLADVPEVLGRTAALWMGHMRPDGSPEPETASACLLLGRITGLEIGKVGGMFDITIESITQDLSKALVAPDLATGTIQDGFYLTNPAWRSFAFLDTTPPTPVTISSGVYASPAALAAEITTKCQAAAVAFQGTTCEVVTGDDGNSYFQFSAKGEAIILGASLPTAATSQTSLLWALGFDSTSGGSFPSVPTTDGTAVVIRASRPVARVFVPTYDSGNANALTIRETNVGSFFFSDQGDGTGYAWARFGDGQVVLVKAKTSTTVTTGQVGFFPVSSQPDDTPGRNQYYYVGQDATPTITQVIQYLSIGSTSHVGLTQYLGMLLASTTGHTADGILNVFPEGVGLGWFRILTAADWLIADETAIPRMVAIDNTTAFKDLFTPYARLHGLFLVWDPSAGAIRLRRIHPPTKAGASSSGTTTASFTESNRAKVGDRTSQKQDRASLRTSWQLKAGFSLSSFAPQTIVINDVRARSMYPNDARQEDIEDKTLIDIGPVGAIVQALVKLYGAPYTICSRSMNKRGMLLAPGTIHQIVDNTMVNPFTGAAGITSGNAVYCFLTRVAMNPSTGDVTIEFAINSTDDQSLYRQWSPTALVNFAQNTGGFTHGYNSSSKILSTSQKFGTDSDGDGTSQYFDVGDTVRIITRDNGDDSVTSSQTDTLANVNDGLLTLTTGISALSTVSETVVVLQKYNSATASRQSGATRVSWQGDGGTRLVQSNASVRLNRWS